MIAGSATKHMLNVQSWPGVWTSMMESTGQHAEVHRMVKDGLIISTRWKRSDATIKHQCGTLWGWHQHISNSGVFILGKHAHLVGTVQISLWFHCMNIVPRHRKHIMNTFQWKHKEVHECNNLATKQIILGALVHFLIKTHAHWAHLYKYLQLKTY